MALVLECEGVVTLSLEEQLLLAREISGRLPEETAKIHAVASRLPNESLVCLIWSAIPRGTSQDDLAVAWAYWIVGLVGRRGSYESADEDEIALLRMLMVDWPLYEDSWWRQFWSALPSGNDSNPINFEAIHVRFALYEALHGLLPEVAWQDRLQSLAALEEIATSQGSFALRTLGAVLKNHYSGEELLRLFGPRRESNWTVALMLALPESMKWPNHGHAMMPNAARQAIVDLRDDGTLNQRVWVLQNQWQLLGPTVASADLESFTLSFRPDPGDVWFMEATMRIHAAVGAFAAPATRGDQEALNSANQTLRQFFTRISLSDTSMILESLRNSSWRPSTSDMVPIWRTIIAEILGPELIEQLPAGVRSWLQS